MFFDWFGVEVSGGSGLFGGVQRRRQRLGRARLRSRSSSMIAIVAALGVAVLRLTDSDFEPPVSLNAVVAVLGGLSVLLILFRIIDPPGVGSFGGVSVDVEPAVGIFLGLIAAAGIAYGGYRAMQEEGTSFGDDRRPALRRRQVRRRRAAAAPQPPPPRYRHRPPPPAAASAAVS